MTVAKAKRTGDEWARLIVSDMNGTFDVLVFNKRFIEYRGIIRENNIVFIEGKVNIDDKGDRGSIYLDKMYLMDDYIKILEKEKTPAKVVVSVAFKDFGAYRDNVNTLLSILNTFKGHNYVQVILETEKKMKVIKESPVDYSDTLIKSLNEKFGAINVKSLEGQHA